MPVYIKEKDERLSFAFYGADIFYRRLNAQERAAIQRRCIDTRRGRINVPKFDIERVAASALGWDNVDCFISESEEIILVYDDAQLTFRRLLADEREKCWNHAYHAKANTVDLDIYWIHQMCRSVKTFHGFRDRTDKDLRPTFDVISRLPQKLLDKWKDILVEAYPSNGLTTMKSDPLAFHPDLIARLPDELVTKWVNILDEYDEHYDTDDDKKNSESSSTVVSSTKDLIASPADDNA